MRVIDLDLHPLNKETEIQLQGDEEQVLLEVHKTGTGTKAFCTGVFNYWEPATKEIPGYMTRLFAPSFKSLKISGEFTGEGSIKGHIYIGSWAQVLITDIGKLLDHLYLSETETGIKIGREDTSNLSIFQTPTGKYQITRNLLKYRERFTTIKSFSKNDAIVPELNRIEALIKDRLANTTFLARQDALEQTRIENTFELISAYA